MILADFTNATLPVLLIAEPVHLQNVMREAYEGPLRAHLVDTTQQKLPESARLFDLPEHRFHNHLAGRVHRFARLGLQLASRDPPAWLLGQRTARAPLLPMLSEPSQTAGPLGSPDVTPVHCYYGPGRVPLAVHRLPGVPGYTASLLRRFLDGTRRVSPVA